MIATGYATSNGKNGKDTFYFSTDPSVSFISINDQPTGVLPEIPYTGIFAFVIVAAVACYMIIKYSSKIMLSSQNVLR